MRYSMTSRSWKSFRVTLASRRFQLRFILLRVDLRDTAFEIRLSQAACTSPLRTTCARQSRNIPRSIQTKQTGCKGRIEEVSCNGRNPTMFRISLPLATLMRERRPYIALLERSISTSYSCVVDHPWVCGVCTCDCRRVRSLRTRKWRAGRPGACGPCRRWRGLRSCTGRSGTWGRPAASPHSRSGTSVEETPGVASQKRHGKRGWSQQTWDQTWMLPDLCRSVSCQLFRELQLRSKVVGTMLTEYEITSYCFSSRLSLTLWVAMMPLSLRINVGVS